MSTFYPHGKPDIYSYTTKFVKVGNDINGEAEMNTKYPGLDGQSNHTSVYNKALESLRSLIIGARNAETAFLRDTGIDLKDEVSAQDVFKHMNEILNSKQTFERGLKYMERLSKVGSKGPAEQTYRDVSRFFGSYLDEAIKEELKNIKGLQIAKMNNDQIKQYINNIISKALTLSYERVKDFVSENGDIRGKFGKRAKSRENEEEVQAITDMIDVIERLRATNAFSQFGKLFNLDKETLLNWRSGQITFKKRKGNKYNNAQVDNNYGGNALEVITTMIAAELGNINIQNNSPGGQLHIVGKHTGQKNQMKADTLLFVGKGSINPDDYLEYVDAGLSDSVRVQNVNAMKKYLDNLEKNISHIIAISDKNYSIKADFGGINAQEKMNLQDVGAMLSEFSVGDVKELINYLANCGADMVQGDVHADIRTELQTYIGYFLFDHLEIQIGSASSGPNVVNLINVSGIYIPLSVYLEGIFNSLQEALTSPSRLVSVSISLGGPTEADSHWTQSLWEDFRREHETESYISYRILKGIADFITGLQL